jgi:uncharacterized protein YdcH (DUF465 family)
MLRELEQVRSELNHLIDSRASYEQILEVSEKLDKLIMEHMNNIRNEYIIE